MATLDGDELKQAFLDALAETGILASAMRASGVKAYATPKRWRDSDPDFAQAYAEALEAAADTLEAEARRRASEGVVRVKFHPKTGEQIDEVQYSDTLMMFLLKGSRPDKFAERTKSELSGPGGAPMEVNDGAMSARIAALLDEAKRRRDNAAQDPDPFS